jgi:hypothetical protein
VINSKLTRKKIASSAPCPLEKPERYGMNTYLILFVIAMFTSVALTPIVRRISERFGWLDHPHESVAFIKRRCPVSAASQSS